MYTAEYFHFNINNWIRVRNLPEARIGFTASTHRDKIFLGGGITVFNVNALYYYDILQDNYIKTPISL